MATRGRQLGRVTLRAGRRAGRRAGHRARRARPALPAHASRGRPKLNSHELSSRKSGWTKTLKLYTKTGLRTEPRMSCLGAVTLSPRGLSSSLPCRTEGEGGPLQARSGALATSRAPRDRALGPAGSGLRGDEFLLFKAPPAGFGHGSRAE